jgi:(2Fe-2S) ferredoxin
MGETVRKLEHHVFVCTNERPAGHPRGCCKAKNAEELVTAFKKELASAGLAGQVRAQRAGCLDTCEWGASLVVYPDNVWYGKVSLDDVHEIVRDHLVGGRPVERLRIPGK